MLARILIPCQRKFERCNNKIRNENDTREWIRIMSTVLGKKDKH